MLEGREPGTEEPPHWHPGDDMTVVVEGSCVRCRSLHRGGVGYGTVMTVPSSPWPVNSNDVWSRATT